MSYIFKAIFVAFGFGVIGLYSAASLFGWELANQGSKSRLGVPFIYGGFRGGK